MTVARKSWAFVGSVVLASMLGTACAHTHRNRIVYIQGGPPNAMVEIASVSPGAGYCWISGHYRWDGGNYVWTGGRFQLAPRGRTVWVTGRWQSSPRGWHWVEGYWS